MPPRITPFHQLLTQVLLLLLLASTAVAQSISPSAEEAQRVAIDSFSLDGFSAVEEYPMNIERLRQRLAEERAAYPVTMSVGEMHLVADAMTLHMRAQGYIFHTVYLPPQKVEQGVVQLKLQEGRLADVHVINQSPWPDKRFEKVFKPLIGDLLYGPRVEERVQAIKAQAGVQVFAFYSRGAKPGEARLNLRVQPASQRNFSLKVDNFGSDISGKHRAIVQYTENQLTGHFDRLSLAVLHGLDDIDNTYGSLYYSLPFGRLNYIWDVNISNNEFELGDRFEALGLKGDASTLATGLTRVLGYGDGEGQRIRFGLYEKRSNLDSEFAAVEAETSQAVTLEWSTNKQQPAESTLFNLSLELTHGRYLGADEDIEPAEFNKLDLSAGYVRGMSTGRGRNVLQLSLRGQYSDVNLPSVETAALTGPYGVRSFVAGGFSGDRAALATVEWSLPNLINNNPQSSWRLEPLFFVDWGSGRKLQLDETSESEASFSGAGVGARFALGRHFSGQVTVSAPIAGEMNDSTVDGDELWLFEVRWH